MEAGGETESLPASACPHREGWLGLGSEEVVCVKRIC